MPLDRIAHVAVAYGLTLTLHLVGLPWWASVSAPSVGAVAWELRQHESRVEHQQDIVTSVLAAIGAEAVWQNTAVRAQERAQARRACIVLTGRPDCQRVRPDTLRFRIILTSTPP